MRSTKGIVNTIATGWVPAIALITCLTNLPLTHAIGAFLLGYILFICVYEIGYFYNDTLGTRHDEVPRRRLPFQPGEYSPIALIAGRLTVFSVLAFSLGLGNNSLWISFYVALVGLIFLHNVLRSTPLKFATFIQLSAMRFVAPIVPFVSVDELLACTILGIFVFSFGRLITYMDGKDRLTVNERSGKFFNAQIQLLALPTTALLSLYTGSIVYVCISLYFIVLYSTFGTFPQIRKIVRSEDRTS